MSALRFVSVLLFAVIFATLVLLITSETVRLGILLELQQAPPELPALFELQRPSAATMMPTFGLLFDASAALDIFSWVGRAFLTDLV